MEDHNKIVDFNLYCPLCKYKKLTEEKTPCDECLAKPVNLNTHRPVYFKEDKDGKQN